jgi:hypothetical protein
MAMILIALTSQIQYSDSNDVFIKCTYVKNLLQDFSKYSNQYGGGLATRISLKASDR